mmetsp:Transcript_16729/g.30460  ORF Transcript_16729/g.30460 Transcript_16729/m.30460 type:complete len:103 (-) Transcript_16729:41-349(-)
MVRVPENDVASRTKMTATSNDRSMNDCPKDSHASITHGCLQVITKMMSSTIFDRQSVSSCPKKRAIILPSAYLMTERPYHKMIQIKPSENMGTNLVNIAMVW